jgi:hypothetical protein
MADVAPDDVPTDGAPTPARPWQFSLNHLFLAMIPVGLLFTWLGALESTTWLNLTLAAVVTGGYLAVECFGDHAGLVGVSRFWRASYFVARAAFFQAICFFVCVLSFLWLPPPNLPPEPPPGASLNESLQHAFAPVVIVLAYSYGVVLTATIAWIANLFAAARIRRARWLLFVTTLPGVMSVLLVAWVLCGGR